MFRIEIEKQFGYFWCYVYVNNRLVMSDFYTYLWQIFSDPHLKDLIVSEADNYFKDK